MTWADALETIILRTGVERYRWLCSEANPDDPGRTAYRQLMIALVMSEPPSSSLSSSTAEDLALRAHVVRHGCGGCP